MEWLPPPRDFRASLRAARAVEPASARIDALVALAQTRLAYLEALQLDDALRTVDETTLPRIRIASLSGATVDHLAPSVRIAGLRRRVRVEVYAGKFGQVRQELMDSGSPLFAFAPDYVVFALPSRSVSAGIGAGADADQADAHVAHHEA